MFDCEGSAWAPHLSFWVLNWGRLICWQECLSPYGKPAFPSSSLRPQPHSALFSAARHTSVPAGKVPSRRGLLPSEGRKAPLCLQDRTYSLHGTCSRRAFRTLWVLIPGLQAESQGGAICSSHKEGVESFYLLGRSHQSPGCMSPAPMAPGCSATPWVMLEI